MVDDERRRGVTDAAGAVVALEDPFPPAGEAVAVASPAVVAGLAEPAAVDLGAAAGAAERDLLRIGDHFERPDLIYDKGHYHRGFYPRRQLLQQPRTGGRRGPKKDPN